MDMKKYIAIVLIALGALCSVSCDKFLDVQTQGYPTQDQYFKNDQQAIDALDACYKELVNGDGVIGREIYWEQACANSIVWGRARNDMLTTATFNYTGDEGRITKIFRFCYTQGMNRCNWVIQQLRLKEQNTTLTAVEKRSLGEAYFLRAYWHFIIAYRYGTKDLGVPFVAYEKVEGGYNNEIPEQQASVMVNYEYIVDDLAQAEELLSRVEEYSNADKGRVHKASAAALMAKVYAYWATWDASQWPNVITCVNRLEQSYGRGLVSDFAKLFSPKVSDFWNEEYCFAWPSTGGFDGGSTGGGVEFPGVCFVNGGYGKFNGWGQIKPSLDLWEEMSKDNVNGEKNYRLKNTIIMAGEEFPFWGDEHFVFKDERDNQAGFLIGKYLQPLAPADPFAEGYVCSNGDYPTFQLNYPIVRFGDCLLLRAEAYLATGNNSAATTDINRIRVRSNLQPITGTATWADLYHERTCELALEMVNDHAYDCKRWAYTGNATTKGTEIAKLATNELNTHPRVREFINRSDPSQGYNDVPYPDYLNQNPWNDKYMTFPYPSEQINKSAGKLKNPPTWQ